MKTLFRGVHLVDPATENSCSLATDVLIEGSLIGAVGPDFSAHVDAETRSSTEPQNS